ncbi:tripartite tricarboxylate transporter TctB family protein [Maritimibacter dapengensis]|uniref:Tripartite tricarboxylate transporter TctB family protein n=1 Tax=Maritimibacter dapengensis TaxID=2836868 RepID=A0ABS6T447_9RHOB|nr:tripartite tricarboxylate transporter TctB family protein [Maritimibacter dapengensis]
MSRSQTFQDLFKRYRRPGDFVISLMSFVFALVLLATMPEQVEWVDGVALYAQPAFWPTVAVIAMVVFSGLHLFGAMVSERIRGRTQEILYWLRSLEFAVWFIAYVMVVPVIGYLPSTLLFTAALTFRLGYRNWRYFAGAAVFSVAVVVIFKGFLQVKIPAGDIYSLLPAGDFRLFAMIWL